jgi:hypothetical protein
MATPFAASALPSKPSSRIKLDPSPGSVALVQPTFVPARLDSLVYKQTPIESSVAAIIIWDYLRAITLSRRAQRSVIANLSTSQGLLPRLPAKGSACGHDALAPGIRLCATQYDEWIEGPPLPRPRRPQSLTTHRRHDHSACAYRIHSTENHSNQDQPNHVSRLANGDRAEHAGAERGRRLKPLEVTRAATVPESPVPAAPRAITLAAGLAILAALIFAFRRR